MHKLTKIRDEDGKWVTSAKEIDATLWKSRRDIWTTTPHLHNVGLTVLQVYMEGRQASIPAKPDPRLASLSTVILKAGGSAPGCDNTPYEVYHFGVNFTAHLLGQALHACEEG